MAKTNKRTPTLAALYRAHVATLVSAYEDLFAESRFDSVVIHSGHPKMRTAFDDQYFPHRVVPHFQHWLPLAHPGCVLLIRKGKTPTLLWPNFLNVWENAAPPEELFFMDELDVVRPATPAEFDAKIRRFKTPKTAFVGEDASDGAPWGFGKTTILPKTLLLKLNDLRVLKTPYELACLREANRRAAKGHVAVRSAFESDRKSELDLHLLYLQATAQDDPETPYKNIVALGENAATLHHIDYKKFGSKSAVDSLLLDAGSTYLGYCSDITRTWIRGTGARASAFLGLIEQMEAMQIHLCEGATVGRRYETLHDETHQLLGGILHDVGLVNLAPEEIVSSGISRAFLPHGLGHSLGLQCHDVGCALVKPRADNPFLRNTTLIEAGQVFTIEPGLYFIEGLLAPFRTGKYRKAIDWKLVDALAPLGGIRIEDDLFIEKKSHENMTRKYLKHGGGVA